MRLFQLPEKQRVALTESTQVVLSNAAGVASFMRDLVEEAKTDDKIADSVDKLEATFREASEAMNSMQQLCLSEHHVSDASTQTDAIVSFSSL